LATLFCGSAARDEDRPQDIVYVIMNAHWETASFELPRMPRGIAWRVAVNTSMPPPQDSYAAGAEIVLDDQTEMIVGARSVAILVGR
jgi:glycogen operon protein